MRKPSLSLFTILMGMLLLTACSEADEAPITAQTVAPRTPTLSFASGIYFTRPGVDRPSILTRVDGASLPRIGTSGIGFDIQPRSVVYADGSRLVVVSSEGEERTVLASGLFAIARPSLSPDGKRVVVQASESEPAPGAGPSDINIYVVDLETGQTQRISFLSVNEESPEWFPDGNRIAYSSFSPEEGIRVHIYDADAGREVVAFEEGAIHLAVSPDGRLVFNPQLVRLYDAATGEMVSDMRDRVLAALEAGGYRSDTRFPGQAGRGTFPLDADFSPVGDHIVLDGAVEKDGKFGIVVFKMTLSGDDLTALTGLIDVDPARSSSHNFSQLNPSWLGE